LTNLKQKAINGVFWTLTERFGNQGIQFAIGLILARILLPSDYGLLGMILIFISVAQVFVEGGFSSALIRKKDPTESDYSTVFWFNLSVATICYISIYFSSPLIADFFNEPVLVPICRVVGLNIVISAFSVVQKTLLTKKLDFRTQAIINLSSILVSGCVGVACAFNGYGVWSLVIQNIFKNSLISLAMWLFNRWRPLLVFSKVSFNELFSFGSNLLFSSLINTMSENLYSIVIGKFYNPASLGFYTRADQFQKLPVSSIYGAIGTVSFPVLASLQNDQEKLRSGYRSMIRLIAFVLFPIMGILAVISKPMISVVLTEKWLPSVPILQMLCIVGALYPIHAINLDILKVKGRTDIFFKLEVIKQILNVLSIVICLPWGINGLVWGLVILNLVCYFLNSYNSKVLIGYSTLNQIRDILPFAVITVFSITVLYFVGWLIKNQIAQMITFPILGVSIYLFTCFLFRFEEVDKIKSLILIILKKENSVAV
jgi:teichuronic acid exporter